MMSHLAAFALPIARLWCALLVLAVYTGFSEPARADVLIGVAAPSQGAKAQTGREIRRAADLAAAHINAEGGIEGQRVAVVSTDDGCSEAQAEAAARTLVAQQVALVLGHPCTGAAIAAARIYAQAGTPFIASATRHPDLTDARAGPSVFRLAGRDDKQGTTAGTYLAQHFKDQPIAVVYDGSRYAKALVKHALPEIKASGTEDVLTATVRGGQKDYAALIAKLKKTKTKALFFAGFPMEGALLLRQMRSAGLDTEFLSGDALATTAFADTAGTAANGAIALLPHDAQRVMTESAPLDVETNANGALLSAYAAVEAWRDAVQRAGSTEATAVSKALQSGRFATVLGPVSFDEKGDASVRSYDVVEWKDDAWRPKN